MKDFLRALTRGSGWLGLTGLLLIAVLLLVAAFGPLLELPDPVRTNLRARMVAPTLSWAGLGAFPLGTDQLGRDKRSRILSGGQLTLAIGAAATISASSISGKASCMSTSRISTRSQTPPE